VRAGVHRYRALDPPAEGRGCIYVLQIKSLSQIRHAAYNMLALFQREIQIRHAAVSQASSS
jgi:hypothetical protein